jgi:hypothetical protein
MTGQNGVRPETGGGTDRIDVGQPERASGMVRTTGERRVVDRNNDRARELFRFDTLQGSNEEVGLAGVEDGVLSCGAGLGGDYARIFEDVAVKPEDANEGRLEGEVERSRAPASGVCIGVAAQKLAMKASRLFAVSLA